MATTAFELLGKILLQGGDRVKSQLDEIGTQTQEVKQRFSLAGVAMEATGNLVAAAVTQVGSLVTESIKAGISYNAMQEQSKVAWTTLLGSQGEAADMMKRISDFAKATPFETADVDMMAKYMHNAGLSGEELFQSLMQVSDVASAFAIPAADAKELTRQMSQVRQAGVAYTEDLNVLQDRGVPIFKAISEQLGITIADVKKMASEGKLSSDIYIKAFNGIADSVKGASDAQSKTFSGMISTLKDNLGILAGTLTAGLFDYLKGALNYIVDLLGRLNEAFQKGGIRGALEVILPKSVVDALVSGAEAIKAGFLWIIDNWKTVVAGLGGIVGGILAFEIMTGAAAAVNTLREAMIAFTLVTEGMTIAEWALNAAMAVNPFTWIAIAIGLVIAAAILLVTHWQQVSTFFTQLWAYLKALFFESLSVVVSFLVGVWQSIWGEITSVWNSIVGFLAPILEQIKNIFQIAFYAAFFIVYTALKMIWDYISPTVLGIYNYFKEKFDAIKGYIESALLLVYAIIQNLMGQWLAYINPKLDEIHKNMSALWDKVKQVWNEALNAIATAIRNAYVNYIKPEVDFLADGILKIWHDLIDPVYNIGSDIVDGLSQGISDAWGRFKSGIVEMADKGKALFQEVFGVGSPSTFTTWIGEMLGKGMSQGMTNSIGGVMDSAKSMMSGVTGALGGSFSPTMNMAGAMAGGGGMAGQRGAGGRYNVEIPLVVNGREIARAIAPDIDQQLERQRKITVRAKGV